MTKPENNIRGSEELLSLFGYWPSFHDAEVIEMLLWRGEPGSPQSPRVPPQITIKFHLWEMTSEVDASGYFVNQKNSLVTMRFSGIQEIELEGFNHQNVIMGLAISMDGDSPELFKVEINPSFGVSASFTCRTIDVVSVTPITETKPPTA